HSVRMFARCCCSSARTVAMVRAARGHLGRTVRHERVERRTYTAPMGLAGRSVLVTGGAGFLGAPVCRLLRERGAGEVSVPRQADHDLTSESSVAKLFEDVRPEVVIHLAAEVGGIGANRENPGRFFYANMAMGLHVIEQARLVGVQKFVQVGTVCSYPKFTP